jgi:glutamate/tyrosine decarboxylase-like PLP-dependent enzyme
MDLNDKGPPAKNRTSSLDLSEQEFALLSERFVSLVEDYFTHIGDLKVFPDISADALAAMLSSELPTNGISLDEIVESCRKIIAASRHNGHPRFWGYVASPSTAPGAFADLLASALNSNVTSWRSGPAATQVEKLVIGWLAELTGFGAGTHGVLTSGGSMANLNALIMAHRARCGADVATNGIGAGQSQMTVYATDQVHHSVIKAADLTGLGRDKVRFVETDERFQMNVRDLSERLAADRSEGMEPFCVIGSAGTVSTGVVDPLTDIARIARENNLWFHVDGAYGAPAAIDSSKRELFRGAELADSMSVDAHKWLYSPVDCGCLLFRDPAAARRAFSESSDAEYIRVYEREGEESYAFWDYGIELSRRFRALKVWMLFNYFGRERISAAISEDNALAAYMAECIDAAGDMELLAPVELSICCFRFAPPEMRGSDGDGQPSAHAEQRLNDLNSAVMHAVQRRGRTYLSNAMLRGRFALRACIVNFRTSRADIDLALDEVRQVGTGLVAEGF